MTFTEKLVMAVEKRPELWGVNNWEVNDIFPPVLKPVWDSVAREVFEGNLIGFEGEFCRQRWIHIKEKFIQFTARLEKSIYDPISGEDDLPLALEFLQAPDYLATPLTPGKHVKCLEEVGWLQRVELPQQNAVPDFRQSMAFRLCGISKDPGPSRVESVENSGGQLELEQEVGTHCEEEFGAMEVWTANLLQSHTVEKPDVRKKKSKRRLCF